MTSKLSTTTDPDWLENDHAGDLLLSEFLEPLDMTIEDLADAIALGADHIRSVIDGDKRMDAEMDLRLGRYFGMSEGFFLRLQNTYELIEAKRALNGELDRIVQRAA
jgi:addiction module HigA family antidote